MAANTPALDRYVAVVPGIMGSTLSYSDTEIWGNNILQNYWRLSKGVEKLRWGGNKAEAELWKQIEVVPGVKFRLWDKTLNHIYALPTLQQNRVIECPYDWRQSLQDSASDIVQLLQERLGAPLENDPGTRPERLAIVTHSMGALAMRVAIGKKLLHPGWIDRLIHMAPPLLGAPVAFRSLIYKTTIPFLNEAYRIVHFVNYHRLVENLYNAFQTFDSIYELMPPRHTKFLFEAGIQKTSLSSQWIDDPQRLATVLETHKRIADSHQILRNAKTPVYSIFTNFQKRPKTDVIYQVAKGKIKSRLLVPQGDGTVPDYSSDLKTYGGHVFPIQNVGHMWMPNHRKAVDLLRNCGL